MEITAEMALRELRRRGKLGNPKDSSRASQQRARNDGTMELSSSLLRSIAGAQATAPKDSKPAAGTHHEPGSRARQGVVSSRSAPISDGNDQATSEVESLVHEFRNAHQLVSKAEIRELQRKLPGWLANHPYETVETAVRRGETVGKVGYLVKQIGKRRSQLQGNAAKGKPRAAGPTRSPAAERAPTGSEPVSFRPEAEAGKATGHVRHEPGQDTAAAFSQRVDSADTDTGAPLAERSSILDSDAERAVYVRFEMHADNRSGVLGIMYLSRPGGPLSLQHYDLGGCDLESSVRLDLVGVDHLQWKSLAPKLALGELADFAREEDRLIVAWSADTLSAILELDLSEANKNQLRLRFRSGLEIATAWRALQPKKRDVPGDSIAAFMEAAGIPVPSGPAAEGRQPGSDPAARAVSTITRNHRRLNELRDLIARVASPKPASNLADPVVIGGLEHVEGLPWADGFHSNFISLGAPVDFASLRDECAALRRKIEASSTPARLSRAEKLLSLAAEVEEFNSLPLQEAASRVIGHTSPTGDEEAALHAYIGMRGHQPGNSTESAAAGSLSRQRFLRLRTATRKKAEGRVWLPQLEQTIISLERADRAVGPNQDAAVVLVPSAIADLLGTDGQRLRLSRFGPSTGGTGTTAADPGVDIESELRRISEPYGFLRVSDAIDRLVDAGFTTSLPDLQRILAETRGGVKIGDGWWWFTTSDDDPSNAVRVAEKIAYVASRSFTGSDLQRALLRQAMGGSTPHEGTDFVPPGEVLTRWAELVDGLTVDDQQLVYTSEQPSDEMLSELELTVAEAIAFSRGGVCSTEELANQLWEYDTRSRPAASTLASMAIVDEVVDGVWCLCGAEHDPQIAEILGKRSRSER
ncbi:MAG: hypothetical protein RIB98_14920 [Acidimicrobiales bacterium]